MKLIVGLGNPGEKYRRTRHNLGFLIVDRFAARQNILVARECCDALIGEGFVNGEKIVVVKPQTFTNRSGTAVAALLREFTADAAELIVVYDDLDLPFGRIRIRLQGSAGGHRGIGSILASLDGAPFCRVRLGIGRPPQGVDPIDHVLQPFSPSENDQLEDLIDRAAAAIDCLIADGAARAMEVFNRAP